MRGYTSAEILLYNDKDLKETNTDNYIAFDHTQYAAQGITNDSN